MPDTKAELKHKPYLPGSMGRFFQETLIIPKESFSPPLLGVYFILSHSEGLFICGCQSAMAVLMEGATDGVLKKAEKFRDARRRLLKGRLPV